MDIFTLTDGGCPRKTGAMLKMVGHKNANCIGGIARALGQMCVHPFTHLRASAPICEQIIRLTKGAADRIASTATCTRIVRVPCPSLAVITFWATTDLEGAEKFLCETQAVSGPKKSPSRALATWLSRHVSSSGAGASSCIAVTASAIIHYMAGNQVEKLYGSEDQINEVLETNLPLKIAISKLFSYEKSEG